MYVDAISSSDSDTIAKLENEMDNHLAERLSIDPQALAKESERKSEEISYSAIARWRKRATHFKALETTIQQWRQKDTQEVADLGILVPSTLGFKSRIILNEVCVSCTQCKALAEVKATCLSFVKNKEEYLKLDKGCAIATKALANAEIEYENLVTSFGHSTQNAMMLDLTNRLVSKDADGVADKAALLSKQAELVSQAAELVYKNAEKIYRGIREVKSLLAALRTASNETMLLTTRESLHASAISIAKQH
jgi:hypothetical protein